MAVIIMLATSASFLIAVAQAGCGSLIIFVCLCWLACWVLAGVVISGVTALGLRINATSAAAASYSACSRRLDSHSSYASAARWFSAGATLACEGCRQMHSRAAILWPVLWRRLDSVNHTVLPVVTIQMCSFACTAALHARQ